MAKIVLDPVTSGYQSTSQVNSNNSDIATNLNDQILYRNNPEGEPNEMLNLLDMNSNRIINIPNAIGAGEPVSFGQLLTVLGDAIGDSGSGQGGINLPYVVESTVLVAGQTVVSYVSNINLSVFSISDLSADSHRLIESVDYSIDLNTQTITLFNSYPAGTTLLRYREQSPAEGASAEGWAEASEDWAISPEDTLVPIASGGNEIDEYSSLHWAKKAEASAALAPANEGYTLYQDVSGTVILDAVGGTVSIFKVVPNGNITSLTIANAPVDPTRAFGITVILESDGASTVMFGSQFIFVGGTPPILSTGAGERDYIIGLSVDDGVSFDSEVGIVGIGP